MTIFAASAPDKPLSLAGDGAEYVPGAVAPMLDLLGAALDPLQKDRPGLRLRGIDGLADMLAPDGMLGSIVSARLGAASRPVRAILFDKTARTNWSLGWHQDRTICVRQRRDVPGFGPWSLKQGLQHVEPPFALLAQMITIRVHLDDVPSSNGPLLIAPGSHRLGKLRESEIEGAVRICGSVACLANAGDIWVYATPILHASPTAISPSRRRVLQVDFSADALPGGLSWLGI